MRNVLIVDDAANATFSVFQMTQDEFAVVFSRSGQDIAFIDEVAKALGDDETRRTLAPVWDRPILRSEAQGVHGLLIFGGQARRPHFPISGREVDFDERALNPAQRQLFRNVRGES